MELAIVTDNHAGCRNDSPVFNEYCISFFTDQFIPFLLENKITTVLHLGDVFDRRKYVNFNTLALWRTRVFDVLQKHNIQMYITLGNHDVYYKNTNDINSVYELLRGYDNIKIYSTPETIQIDGLPIFLLPWIPQGQELENLKAIEETKAEICMGHLEIKGFEMFTGQVNREHGQDAKVFEKFDLVFTGHFHHKSSKGNIHYLGSPYQMTWNDWADIRGFHTFNTTTREIKFIENPKQIFKKIFYNDEGKTFPQVAQQYDCLNLTNLYVKIIVEKKDNPYWYDQFLEAVYAANPADVSIFDQSLQSYDEEEEVDGAKDTLTILHEHVNCLDIQHKDKLNELLTSLYQEALTLEVE